MSKFRDLWTLKVHLGRHGFEFHHNPSTRVTYVLNGGMILSVVPLLFDFRVWPLALLTCGIYSIAALLYKEPAK